MHNARLVAVHAHAHRYFARAGELDGVVYQIHQHLVQPHGVAFDNGQQVVVNFCLQDQALGFGQESERLGGPVHRGGHIKGDALEVYLAGLNFGEVQNVVDNQEQALGIRQDKVQVLALFGGAGLLAQQPRQAHNAVHGRANFVAHVGQEYFLGPHGVFGRHQGAVQVRGVGRNGEQVAGAVGTGKRLFGGVVPHRLAIGARVQRLKAFAAAALQQGQVPGQQFGGRHAAQQIVHAQVVQLGVRLVGQQKGPEFILQAHGVRIGGDYLLHQGLLVGQLLLHLLALRDVDPVTDEVRHRLVLVYHRVELAQAVGNGGRGGRVGLLFPGHFPMGVEGALKLLAVAGNGGRVPRLGPAVRRKVLAHQLAADRWAGGVPVVHKQAGLGAVKHGNSGR